MSLSICFFDVTDPRGKCKRDAVYVLYGEGSPFQYAKLACNAIAWGAGVVAIADGIDVTKDGGNAVIVFSKEKKRREGVFVQGKTLDECSPDDVADGERVVNVVNIRGKDYLRDDKNCVQSDKIGQVPIGDLAAKDGCYATDGTYLGKESKQLFLFPMEGYCGCCKDE